MKEGWDDGFGARLRELRGRESVNSFAKRCEVPEASMRAYLEGKIPTADRALRIAQKANADFEWLVAGRDVGNRFVDDVAVSNEDGSISYMQIKSAGELGFSFIPRLEVEASAGSGIIAHTEDALDFLAFKANWLRDRGINPQHARILTARGDSMLETIFDGDALLVDTSITHFKDNAIYVLLYGNMVLVKRVHARMNGTVQLISDNPRYPVEELTAGEVELLTIAGRVMWFGRTM